MAADIQHRFDNVPGALRQLNQWVLWKLVTRKGDGKPTKPPYQTNGDMAKSNDPATWTTFAAVSQVKGYAGIGFMFSATDSFCGVDLDGARDPKTGNVADWAGEIIRKFGSYAEVSPSETGVKIFCVGKCPFDGGRKKEIAAEKVCDKAPAIEVYDRGRYFTVTGWRLAELVDLKPAQDALDWLKAKYWPDEPKATATPVDFRSTDAVIERARKYVAKMPSAIEGHGGHDTAFHVACVLVLGFGLNESEATGLFNEYNWRCEPPWSEKEIAHKIESAAEQPGERNYLRNISPKRWGSIPIPRYKAPQPSVNGSGPEPNIEPDPPELSTYQPFPLAALPQPTRDYVDADSAALGVDPAFVALPVLCALAGAIGNSRRLQLKKSWEEPSIVWAGVIGESGTQKSPGLVAGKRFPLRRQKAAFKRHEGPLAEYKAKLARCKKGEPKPKKPLCDRCLVDDVTIEALAPILADNWRGVVIMKDELSAWLNGFDRYAGKGRHGAEAAKWLELHGARPLVIDRKNEDTPTIFVPMAAVSVVGGIPPAVLRRAIGEEYKVNGLLARLLLAWPPRRPKRWTECDVDLSLIKAFGTAYDRLFELAPDQDEVGDPTPKLVTMTPDAKALFIHFANEHGIEQQDLDGDLAAAWSKLEGYAARLALVHHLTRWAANEVGDDGILDAASMSAGIQLARWFAGEARRVYAALEATDQELETAELYKLIQERGGTISARDLARAKVKYRLAGKAEEVLCGLEKRKLGEWVVVPTQGRPARVFRVW
jgi:hypothetical protein